MKIDIDMFIFKKIDCSNYCSFFKNITSYINVVNVEITLMIRENFQQIIRFVFINVFVDTEILLTIQLQKFEKKCLELMRIILSVFEQRLTIESKIIITIMNEDDQTRALMFEKVKSTFVQNILKLLISTRFLEVLNFFSLKLRKIYEVNYEKINLARFDISTLRWYLKISFTDK